MIKTEEPPPPPLKVTHFAFEGNNYKHITFLTWSDNTSLEPVLININIFERTLI